MFKSSQPVIDYQPVLRLVLAEITLPESPLFMTKEGGARDEPLDHSHNCGMVAYIVDSEWHTAPDFGLIFGLRKPVTRSYWGLVGRHEGRMCNNHEDT